MVSSVVSSKKASDRDGKRTREQKVSTDEKHFIKELCGNDDFRYAGHIEAVKDQKNGEGYTKGEKRLLVVGRFRIWQIKKTSLSGRAVTKNIHIYDVYDLATNDPTTLKVYWKQDRKSERSILIRSFDIPLILQAIRESLRSSLYGFVDIPLVRVVQRDSVIIPLGEFDEQCCGHYQEAYEAHCDWLGVLPHPNVGRYINTVNRLKGRSLVLDDIPGVVEANTPDCVMLEPIVLALRYNTFFEGVVCKDATLMDKKLPDMLAQVFSTNTRIEKIDIRNSVSSWSNFFNSLKSNMGHMLNELILPGCKLSTGSVTGLCGAVKVWPFGMKVLDLSGCGLDGRHISSLFHAMRCNLGSSSIIRCLNLSHNNLGEVGSKALHLWMDASNSCSRLEILELVNTDVNLQVVAMGLWHLRFLHMFDARGCHRKMVEDRLQSLKETLTKTNTLNVLGLSSDGSKEDNIMPLIRAFLRNPRIKEATLRLTSVSDGRLLVSTLQGVDTSLLTHVDLSGCAFSEVDLAVLINDMTSTCKHLRTLVLDNSCKEDSSVGGYVTGKKKYDSPVSAALAIMLHSALNLRRLSLNGGFKKSLMGCIKALANCTTVTHLDIRNNGCGDNLAYELAMALDTNRSLTHLWCSENEFTLNGWMSILSGLVNQVTPTCIQYFHRPVQDEKVHISKGKIHFQQYTNILDRTQRAVAQSATAYDGSGPLTDVWEVHHLGEDDLRFEPRLSLPLAAKAAQDYAIKNGEMAEFHSFAPVNMLASTISTGGLESPMSMHSTNGSAPFNMSRFQTYKLKSDDESW
eukprot:CFRG3438T1